MIDMEYILMICPSVWLDDISAPPSSTPFRTFFGLCTKNASSLCYLKRKLFNWNFVFSCHEV